MFYRTGEPEFHSSRVNKAQGLGLGLFWVSDSLGSEVPEFLGSRV